MVQVPYKRFKVICSGLKLDYPMVGAYSPPAAESCSLVEAYHTIVKVSCYVVKRKMCESCMIVKVPFPVVNGSIQQNRGGAETNSQVGLLSR